MALDLSKLNAAVANDKTVNDSAITLLNGLSAALRDVANDPVAINALADQIDANSAGLAASVVENTPAAA